MRRRISAREKTRSPGIKLRLLPERGHAPAIAVGLFDPNLDDVGADFSWGTISSTFIAFGKTLGGSRGSITAGYGFDWLTDDVSRLDGLFGGASWRLAGPVYATADYDGVKASAGAGFFMRGIDVKVAWPGRRFMACRYRVPL